MRHLLIVAVVGTAVALPAGWRASSRGGAVPPAGLQAAIDAARPGDVITLSSGATYTGPFHLPVKDGTRDVVIQWTNPFSLPPGVRMAPGRVRGMPKLTAASGPVITADPGAHNYRLVGLEIAPAPGVFVQNVIQFGSVETSVDQVPHDLTIDRCYVHGDPDVGSRRGLALNSASTTVTNSYFSDFKEVGADSQAIAGWNGPGPFEITNNELEGAGENIMFGGADPTIPGLVPSDIHIARNHMMKPLAWQAGAGTASDAQWSVKNLLELKNAQRVKIEGNLLENNWIQAQDGFSILFTVRNQDGSAPWSIVSDVTFINNLVQHVAAGVNILGFDDIHQSQQTQGVTVRNNLFLDVGGSWGNGRLFQILNGTASVTIDHNTAFQTDTVLFGGDTLPHTGFVFTNNIAPHNLYGVIGSGTGSGQDTLNHYFPNATFQGNILIGGDSSHYPSGNFFPASIGDVGFMGLTDANARLALGSPFRHKATDGTDPGIDLAALSSALGKNLVLAPAAVGRLSEPGAPPRLRLLEVVWWIAFVVLSYAYFGYGLCVFVWARLKRRPVSTRPFQPFVSVVVVAYNEAARIATRLKNLLDLEYPADRLEIVAASDGSTDATVTEMRAFGPRVSIEAWPVRRGKAAVLNDVIPRTHGEVVLLVDVRQRIESDALAALCRNFADPTVGAVSGELVLAAGSGGECGARGAGIYWTCEKWIRRSESALDSTLGATGAIYAIRRDLFEGLPPDTVLDDVLIPAQIVRRGYRVVFETCARAYDRLAASGRDEFVRKVRTIAGTFQLLARERWLWNPRRNRLWLQTVSHKILRLAVPILHAVLFVTNLALVKHGHPFYQAAMAGQIAFYLAAWIGAMWPERRRPRLLVLPYTVCLLSWATTVAFIRFFGGRLTPRWERASFRSATS